MKCLTSLDVTRKIPGLKNRTPSQAFSYHLLAHNFHVAPPGPPPYEKMDYFHRLTAGLVKDVGVLVYPNWTLGC